MKGRTITALVLSAMALIGGYVAAQPSSTPSLLNEAVAIRGRLSIATGAANSREYLADLRKRADKGQPDAALELAGYLKSGEGLVQKDLTKAEQLYLVAADQGNAEAASELANLYWMETKDSTKAIQWSQKAIDLGDGSAAALAGWMYLKGDCVAVDYPEAAEWFRKGAEKADTPSQYFLGRVYEEGLGVKPDLSTAYFWCKLAMEAHHPPARRAVERIKKQLSPDEQTNTDKKVSEWLKKHS